MSGFYLHQGLIPSQVYRGLLACRVQAQVGGRFACLARGSVIEIYRVVSDGLFFHSRHQFHCNIVMVELLPSRHHASDYLWVLDENGRYACWRPNEGYELVQNTVLEEVRRGETGQERTGLEGDNTMVFSGVNYEYEGEDTVGSIFFVIGSRLTVLHFSITRQGLMLDQASVMHYLFPYEQVRYVDWVRSSSDSFLLGVVVEEEEKTVLKVHNLELGLGLSGDSVEWKLQKTNLLQFCSQVSGEILLLTYNEVSLHQYKNQSAIKNYRTRGNYGQICHVGEGIYAHIGEELTLFGRNQLHLYGQIRFQDQQLLRESGLAASCFLGEVEGARMVGVATVEGELYLLAVREKSMRVVQRVESVGAILSMKAVEGTEAMVVMTYRRQRYRLAMLERKETAKLQFQQNYEFGVENLVGVSGGGYLILCCREGNAVFRYNRSQVYSYYFHLPQGSLLAASNRFAVLPQGIFEVDYQSQVTTPLIDTSVLLSSIMEDYVYYLDGEGCLHRYDDTTAASELLCNQRAGDYCWGTIGRTHTLVCASLLHLNVLTLFSHEPTRTISIRGHTLVSSICSIAACSAREARRLADPNKDHLLVAYVDGSLHLHSQMSELLRVFEHMGAGPLRLEPLGQERVVGLGGRQFEVGSAEEGHCLREIRLSNREDYVHLGVYLPKSGLFAYIEQQQGVQNSLIRLVQLPATPNKQDPDFSPQKLLSITPICEFPSAVSMQMWEGRLVVASSKLVQSYNLKTMRVRKEMRHELKMVVGLETIELGLLVCGEDEAGKEWVLLVSEEMELLARFALQAKKPLKSIRAVPDSCDFFLRHDTFATLYRVTRVSSSFQLTQLMGSNLSLQGSSLQIDPETKQLLVNDPFRCLALFHYETTITGMARHVPAFPITAAGFFDHHILIGDQQGQILLYKVISDPLMGRLKMEKVSGLTVGETVTAVERVGEEVYYATVGGQIGYLCEIGKQPYDIMRRMQEQCSGYYSSGRRFAYSPWRGHACGTQKVIDACLILPRLSERGRSVKQDYAVCKLGKILSLLVI